ncbi:MAG: hypothetical protein K9G13_03275 [Aquiluna sp.]|nr:hypothetical protein [Aquiluna sp.]MCF8545542.1 hypothetical protein [Aquiluna sp.]
MVTTKVFKNGGSLAVRLPAGWVQDGEITLVRNPISGEIVISQRAARMKSLLQELAQSEPLEDSVFEEAISREIALVDRSIFEEQAEPDASN